MNMLKGLYFPGTIPRESFFCPLLCLLDRIEYYRIVEDETYGDDESSFWQGRTVLPLGEARDRFLAMVGDIKTHAADYYSGYLSTLSTGALVDRDESSVRQLIASLHGGKEEPGPGRMVTERIWQARLVLRLAEILSRERLELDRELAELNRAEQSLFKAIKGEAGGDEAEFIDTGGAIRAAGGKAVPVERLVKAWSVFYAMDPQAEPLLFTDSEEAVTPLFDRWEEATGARPPLLAEIALPPTPTADAVPACRAELAEVRQPLLDAIKGILEGEGAAGTESLEQAADAWQVKVAAKAGPVKAVDLYLLADPGFAAVWSRISGVPLSVSGGQRQRLVAVLKPAP